MRGSASYSTLMWTANSIWRTPAKRSGICGVARTVAELKKQFANCAAR